MNREEITDLGRKVAAVCPAQRFNAETPDAWEALLGWVDYRDALAAVFVLGQTREFIAPAHIIAEVRRVRADRLKGFVVPAPAAADADAPARYQGRVRAAVHQAAQPRPDRPALGSGERARQFSELGQTYRPRGSRPETDRRPAAVREALARARAAAQAATGALAPLGAGLAGIVRVETRR